MEGWMDIRIEIQSIRKLFLFQTMNGSVFAQLIAGPKHFIPNV